MRDFGKILVVLGLSVAGCAQTPTVIAPVAEVRSSLAPIYEPIAFLKPPILLAADKIEVIEKQRDFANVQPTDFVTSPERIARMWQRQRLRAQGGDARAQYIIENVSARSQPSGDGEIITAALQVRLVMDTANGPRTDAGVRVESEARIPGPITPEERRIILHGMSRDIATELDAKLAKAVQTKLAGFMASKDRQIVKTAPAPVALPSAAKPKPRPVAAVEPVPLPVPARAKVIQPPPAPPKAVPAVPTRTPAAQPVARPSAVAAKVRPKPQRTVQPPQPANSPVAGADGRLPATAWKKGWNW